MGAHPTLLLTGGTGLVGASLYRHALARFRVVLTVHRKSPQVALRRGDRVFRVDLTEAGAVERLLAATEPAVVVHAAALAALPACDADPTAAERLNVDVTARLARGAAAAGAHFVLLSTDQVFDGERGHYREEDEARPFTTYGRTKLAAEKATLEAGGDALVLRTALVLAPAADGRAGALDMVRHAQANGAEVRLFTDEWRTPISVLDLARVLDEALRRRALALMHVAGPDRVDRLTLGHRIAQAFGAAASEPSPDRGGARLVAASQAESGYRRPRDVSLATERLRAEGYPLPQPLPAALAELSGLAL